MPRSQSEALALTGRCVRASVERKDERMSVIERPLRRPGAAEARGMVRIGVVVLLLLLPGLGSGARTAGSGEEQAFSAKSQAR